MAVIGNSSTQQAFTPAVDYFSGNASTTAFTLSRPVASVAQVQVVIDNVAQNPSSAYTVSSNTITFTSAPLSGTNNIYVYYTSPITDVIAPGQGTVTTTSLASSTGTGAVVLGTSPVLTTPALGTPSSLVLTNATGLPQAGLGTNVAGNGPAFGAWQTGGGQALSAGVYTKIIFQNEEFDTNSNFDSTTNYRFTPTVAGYYQLNARFRVSTSVANIGLTIYKNGSLFKDGVGTDTSAVGTQINCLVYANGTTDYFEIYGYFSNSQNTTGGQQATWFNGFLARAA
jgi:hypothetical protein